MRKFLFRLFLFSIPLLVGAICWLTKLLPSFGGLIEELGKDHRDAINNALTTYAATLAGFVSVVGTFVFTFKRRAYFRKYKERGSFTDLMLTHLFSLITMAAIFLLSLVALARPCLLWPALCLTVGSMVQFVWLMMACYFLSLRCEPDN